VNTSIKRLIVLASAVIVFLVLFIRFYGIQNAARPFKVLPLPKAAPRLTTAEAEEILRANFEVIHKVEQVPTAVMEDYTAITHQPFMMVNAGQPVSTDAIIPGVPNKELVLVGLADQRAVVFYTEFGFISWRRVMVFSHKGQVGVWYAEITDHSVNDIPGLRIALQNGQFKEWALDSNQRR